MKKVWVFSLLIVFLFAGMGLVQAKMIHIGETQIVSHPALNNDSKGFKKALEEEGFVEGKNVVFDRENAQGEMSNCYPIAQKFLDDKVNLIHAISTPSAQACVKVDKGIPIVFSSVTDPVKTGIVPKLGKTGTRVTGVSDRWPITLQCEMYQKFVPKAKRWGTIYNPGDINVTFHIKEMKKAVKKMGGKLIEAHVSSSAEVMQAAQSLVGRVDAIHITSDNACVSALEAIVKVCNQNHIPLFVGDRDSVPRGAIAAYGLDYFLVGYEAGKKAAQILKGKNPGEIPAGQATKFTLWINLKAAKIQGVKVPKSLLEKADKVWGVNGKVIKGS
jgi:putative ABC transport system substrate-binding protein